MKVHANNQALALNPYSEESNAATKISNANRRKPTTCASAWPGCLLFTCNNTAAIQAIADGEGDLGITNNYYLVRFQRAAADFPVNQRLFPTQGDIGNLLLVAGMGVLKGSDHSEEAVAFINFLLSDAAQQFFSGEVAEFPVTGRVIPTRVDDISLDDVVRMAPAVDLNTIGDLEGTLELVREAGLL